MKIIVIATLVAAQVTAVAQPAFAADLVAAEPVRAGAFGGLRLRLPLGGSPGESRPRVGLTLAPTLHSIDDRGEVRMRIGEGGEFGFVQGRRGPALSLAGRPIGDYRLSAAQDDDDDEGHGTRDALLVVAGVITLTVVAGAIWFVTTIDSRTE